MKKLTWLFLLFPVTLFAQPDAATLNKKAVLNIADKVAEWQLNNLKMNNWWDHPTNRPYGEYSCDWVDATFYNGLMDFYKVNPKKKYLNSMLDMGKQFRWTIRPRLWDANVLCIGQLYTGLYEIKKDPKMIEMIGYGLNAYFDRHPEEPDVTFKNNNYWWSWWSWCDALYMAPPTFASYAKITGNSNYLKKMDELYKITYNYLYDQEERLFYRDDRFFSERSLAGKKVFWARGNGWVVAGLVKVLQSMPKDYSNRGFYETLFKEMCSRLKDIQQPEGHWSSSLLDRTQYGGVETSGTGLICFALAYGINNGYLNKEEYLPVVEKAWKILVMSVHPDGKLGFVQQIGSSPEKVTYDNSFTYGVGSFLHAASEVYKLSE